MRNKLIYINKINCIKESPDYDMEWDEDLDNLKPKDKKTLTNIKATPLPTGKVIEGSGSNYLSNEIFYRIARSRTKYASTVKTGHFHLANPNPSLVIPDTLTPFSLNNIIIETKKSIERCIQSI